jgi:hypothetical protein
VKVPPAALTAPSNCPRCDAPALYSDHCSSCGLQLAQCGACRGIAGPFDRYCGFCGHDLAVGQLRSPVLRLWLLLAIIPTAGALILLTIFGGTAAVSRVGQLVLRPVEQASPVPSHGPLRALRSQNLHVEYTVPSDWVGYDYSLDRTAPLPLIVVSKFSLDGASFGDTKGDILAARPSGPLLTLGAVDSRTAVDARDPATALAADVANFAARAPTGLKFDLIRGVSGVLANGRTGREAVFRVTRTDGVTLVFERAYISGRDGLFRVDALVPQADWEGGDDRRVEAIIQSVRLTG